VLRYLVLLLTAARCSALQEGTSTCAVGRNKSGGGEEAIVTVDIPRARLPQHCYEKTVTSLSDTWKSNCASPGSETNFFPFPGTVTKCRDPCRIPGNNCHNNDERPIRDICFTQFKNARRQKLFYMCSTGLFCVLTCRQVSTVIPSSPFCCSPYGSSE
jgi:hypothetical protein